MLETFPPPLKAVPLGKVASPQAMTEGVFLPENKCNAGQPVGSPALRCVGVKLRKRYFPYVVGVQSGLALLFKHSGDQLVQVL